MRQQIQYPEAYVEPFCRVHITEARRSTEYFCYGCGRQMVAHLKDDLRQKHYSHKAEAHRCNPNNALHEAAKANIVEGFICAMAERREYVTVTPCSECTAPISTNIARPGAGMASERVVIAGTRSDLVLYDPDPKLIIEIVVSHDLDEQTYTKYQVSRLPVIKIAPSWDNLEGLRSKCVGYEWMNMPLSGRCGSCSLRQKVSDIARQMKYSGESSPFTFDPIQSNFLDLAPVVRASH